MHETQASWRKTPVPLICGEGMVKAMIMYPKRARLSDWETTTRCSYCQTRLPVLTQYNWFVIRVPSSYLPQGWFKLDLQWWILFMEKWNGVSMMSSLGRKPLSITLTSYASSLWGCGAFQKSGEWFQCKCGSEWKETHITVKELLPIVITYALWNHKWQG